MTKVNNTELKKMIDVFGASKVIGKYCENKIYLTDKQLDIVIGRKNNDKKTTDVAEARMNALLEIERIINDLKGA